MVGDDVLFGEGQDDDIVGGWGDDWISGGTGSDGILGDDGHLFTSRNGIAETLYNLPATTQQTISTPGKIQQSTINVPGLLKKTANLAPFNVDPTPNLQDPLFVAKFADDVIFDGLGDDSIHGGSGNDAISGAEALHTAAVMYYSTKYTTPDPNRTGTIIQTGYDIPYNPGNILGYSATRADEFAAYDEYNPLTKIMVGGQEYFLHFDVNDGPLAANSTSTPKRHTDGSDVIFGDLGNDWIVGGTGRDDMYGGWGNDLTNADDNLNSTINTADPYANNIPDTQPSYEDRAYGGAGRDVLIANTGGDRLIDWVGEFNSYLVPFAPFGMATVSRTLQPQLPEFLYALSNSDGVDLTRAADTGASVARNGEPEGELGLVLQKDLAWHDQTGGPSDIQAGNIPGGKRDVLRSANFNDGTAQGFAADSGTWTVTGGRYQVAPTVQGGDAVSVFYVDSYIPSYFEMTAIINAVKPTGGYNANAYLIFDYQSANNFKFAGINVSTNKLEMGHRNASGWVVDKQAAYPGSIKAGIDFSMFLSLNGSAATLIVNNQVSMSFTYPLRVDSDGTTHALNEGMVGLGARNAIGQIDNVVVQRVPPAITLNQTENFSSATTSLFQPPLSGTWTVSNGRYYATAAAGAQAIDLINLSVGALAMVDLNATFNSSAQGGFVFDYYAPDDFKFALLSVPAHQVLLGHRSPRSGWTIDASYTNTSINSATDYRLEVVLKGTTVSAMLNGSTVSSYVYNAVVTDGYMGLISRNGTTSFDVFTVQTDDASYLSTGLPMMATMAPATTATLASLTPSALAPIRAEALRRWSPFINKQQKKLLAESAFFITDLPDKGLGQTSGNAILIDTNGAGYGWFVDPTPRNDSEFIRISGKGPAAGKMDLLTVVMHEMGHVLGLPDSDLVSGKLMSLALSPGQRRTPTAQTLFSPIPICRFGTPAIPAARAAAAGIAASPSVSKSTLFSTKSLLGRLPEEEVLA